MELSNPSIRDETNDKLIASSIVSSSPLLLKISNAPILIVSISGLEIKFQPSSKGISN